MIDNGQYERQVKKVDGGWKGSAGWMTFNRDFGGLCRRGWVLDRLGFRARVMYRAVANISG